MRSRKGEGVSTGTQPRIEGHNPRPLGLVGQVRAACFIPVDSGVWIRRDRPLLQYGVMYTLISGK